MSPIYNCAIKSYCIGKQRVIYEARKARRVQADVLHVWHRRLGHGNQKSNTRMTESCTVYGLSLKAARSTNSHSHNAEGSVTNTPKRLRTFPETVPEVGSTPMLRELILC